MFCRQPKKEVNEKIINNKLFSKLMVLFLIEYVLNLNLFDSSTSQVHPGQYLPQIMSPCNYYTHSCREKRTLVSTMTGDKHEQKRNCKKLQNDRNKMYAEKWNTLAPDDFPDYHPDIYIDPERDDNCITTVRRTMSKIKWSKPPRKSKYHKKCAEKENIIRKIPKHKAKRKTLISDSDIDDILISEAKARHKFSNNCYCADMENTPCQISQKPAKPLIISDDRKKHYSLNTMKKTCMIDYDPESEFLKRLKNGMKKAFDCKCSECMLQKLEKSFKYTNRRAMVEEACRNEPDIYRPERSGYRDSTNNTDITCMCGGPCDCKIQSTSEIRDNNYFETHSIADLQQTVLPHKCVHKFTLDERLLPKPVHTDCWGQSRCGICYKPYQQLHVKMDKQAQMPSKFNLCDKSISGKCNVHLCDKCVSIHANRSNKSVLAKLTAQPSTNSLLKMMNNSQRDLQRVPSCRCSQPLTSKSKLSNNRLPSMNLQTSGSINSRLSIHHGVQTCICGSIYELNNLSVMKGNSCGCKSTHSSLAPKLSSGCRKINICDDNTIVELNTDAAELESKSLSSNKFFEKCKKTKIRPHVMPSNSLALRYQKGML